MAFNQHSLAFSADGKNLFSAGERGPYCMYDLATGECLPATLNSERHVNNPVFSPDNKWLAWLENDAIYVMDRNWKRRTLAKPLEGFTAYQYLCFSPDGKTLAYCAERNSDYDIYTIPVEGGEEKRLTTATGLVFAGDGEGNAFALDSRSGKPLWHYQLGTGMRATGGTTYMVDGRQYYLVPAGSTLTAFALPQ
jgi:Tol biopolymer transport system component